jgi:hypothetical protein
MSSMSLSLTIVKNDSKLTISKEEELWPKGAPNENSTKHTVYIDKRLDDAQRSGDVFEETPLVDL